MTTLPPDHYRLTLDRNLATILIEAMNEAVETCQHEINLGHSSREHDEKHDWKNDMDRYEMLSDRLTDQLLMQGFYDLPVHRPAPTPA